MNIGELIDGFELHFPSIYSRAMTFNKINEFDLLIRLCDGTRMIYDDFTRTIRTLRPELTDEVYRTEFARRLQSIMYRKGITQNQLSNMTGISQPNISTYVNAKHVPGLYHVEKIADALNCDVNDLMDIKRLYSLN